MENDERIVKFVFGPESDADSPLELPRDREEENDFEHGAHMPALFREMHTYPEWERMRERELRGRGRLAPRGAKRFFRMVY